MKKLFVVLPAVLLIAANAFAGELTCKKLTVTHIAGFQDGSSGFEYMTTFKMLTEQAGDIFIPATNTEMNTYRKAYAEGFADGYRLYRDEGRRQFGDINHLRKRYYTDCIKQLY